MDQTSSLSKYVLKAAGLLPVMVLATNTLVAIPIAAESTTLVVRGVLRTSTASRPDRLLGEVRSWDEVKAARVRAVRGKYRNALMSSDEFAKQKAQEVYLEG